MLNELLKMKGHRKSMVLNPYSQFCSLSQYRPVKEDFIGTLLTVSVFFPQKWFVSLAN